MQTLKKWRCGLIPGNYDAVNMAVAYYMIMLCIYSSFATIIPGILMLMVQMLFYGLALNAVNQIVRSFNGKHIIFIDVACIVLICSLFTTKDFDVFGRVGITLVRWCIPLFLLGVAIRDIDDLLKKMKIAAYAVLLITYISIFVTRTSSNVIAAYSQDVGYQNAVPFVIFFMEYMTQKKKSDILGIIVSFVAVLMGGARGPLLCIGVAFFLAWVFLADFDGKSVIVMFVMLMVLFVFAFLFYKDILYVLIGIFEKFGISTRVLSGLISNEIADDASRSTLRNFALEYAKQHPIVGTGIINDRKMIYDNLTINSNKTVYGYYCHNFFLENLMQFGLIPGIIICVSWVKMFLKPMLRRNDENVRICAIVMCTLGFVPLLVSYSYITYQYFFLLAGFGFSYKNIMQYRQIYLICEDVIYEK